MFSHRPRSLSIAAALSIVLFGFVVVTPVAAVETVLIAELSGDQEVPGPGDEDGLGFAELVVDPAAGTVCPAFVGWDGIEEPTAAHIHEGDATVAGPIVVDIFATPEPEGFFESCVEDLDSDLLQDIVDNPAGYYVNLHNDDFPGGAIRGQLEVPPPPVVCTPPNLCGGFEDGLGQAPAGNYVFGGFGTPLSFTLPEPWLSAVEPKGFLLIPDFLFPGEVFVESLSGSVFTGACGATPANIAISPASYAEFFASHPNVSVTAAAQATTLGGASGLVLSVTGTGTASCPGGVALLLQGTPPTGAPPEFAQYVIGDGENIRIHLLQVGGETIFIAVSDLGSESPDDIFALAQPVLDSMVFALGGGATPTPAPTATPAASGTAPPSATPAATARATPRSGTLPSTAMTTAEPSPIPVLVLGAALGLGLVGSIAAWRRRATG